PPVEEGDGIGRHTSNEFARRDHFVDVVRPEHRIAHQMRGKRGERNRAQLRIAAYAAMSGSRGAKMPAIGRTVGGAPRGAIPRKQRESLEEIVLLVLHGPVSG